MNKIVTQSHEIYIFIFLCLKLTVPHILFGTLDPLFLIWCYMGFRISTTFLFETRTMMLVFFWPPSEPCQKMSFLSSVVLVLGSFKFSLLLILNIVFVNRQKNIEMHKRSKIILFLGKKGLLQWKLM